MSRFDPRFDPVFDRWTPALRRAVMRVCPDLFGWPPERQTRYRIALPPADRTAIVAELLKTLPKSVSSTTHQLEDEDHLPLPLQHRVNELLQPLVGIGQDAFLLNELFEDGVCLLDFATLRAYDEDCHATDQRLRAEHDAVHHPRPYRGYLHGHWGRVLIDDGLTYLTLSMAAAYVFDRVEDAATEEIQARIPHRYVPGPHDGETDGDMVRWDLRTEAGGQEALLAELQESVWKWTAERWFDLHDHWMGLKLAGAYILDDPAPGDSPDERNLQIVFTDPAALGQIRFETFLTDLRSIQREISELEAETAVETDRARAFVAEQHEELLRTFDPTTSPKVARLRKPRKIMLHRNAFDDL